MRLTTITAVAMLMAGAAFAEDVTPDSVQFGEDGQIEASLTGAAGDADNGRKVMIDRGKGNCVACHVVSALSEAPFPGNVGPTLDGVGANRSEAELRGLVTNPKMMFEGTVMPAFYRTSGFTRPGQDYTGKAVEGAVMPILSAQEVEDVVAFLKTLQDS